MWTLVGWAAWVLVAALAVSWTYGCRTYARHGLSFSWMEAVQAFLLSAITVVFLLTPLNKLHILWLVPLVLFGSQILVFGNVPILRPIVIFLTGNFMKVVLVGAEVPGRESVGTWFNRGVAHCNKQQYPQAIVAFREAIRLKPNLVEAWTNLGSAYSSQGDYAAAVSALLEATRLRPDLAEAWIGPGVVYIRKGEITQAIPALREAVRLKPDIALAWYNLGLAYMKQEQYGEAGAAFQEAVRLKPDDVDAWFFLGVAYFFQEDWQRVIEIYLQLKILDPAKADEFFRNYGHA